MSLVEKIGQMHQVGCDFANTGPMNPNTDQGKDLRNGRIGSMLNVAGVEGIHKIQKVSIEQGETKTVKFRLSPNDLKYYDVNMKWTVEPGKFNVLIGGNSRDLLKSSFELTKK